MYHYVSEIHSWSCESIIHSLPWVYVPLLYCTTLFIHSFLSCFFNNSNFPLACQEERAGTKGSIPLYIYNRRETMGFGVTDLDSNPLFWFGGDGCVHYLDCGDGLMSKFIKWYT